MKVRGLRFRGNEVVLLETQIPAHSARAQGYDHDYLSGRRVLWLNHLVRSKGSSGPHAPPLSDKFIFPFRFSFTGGIKAKK
jgi:hypothetical protein